MTRDEALRLAEEVKSWPKTRVIPSREAAEKLADAYIDLAAECERLRIGILMAMQRAKERHAGAKTFSSERDTVYAMHGILNAALTAALSTDTGEKP